jgi:hypothetical protein
MLGRIPGSIRWRLCPVWHQLMETDGYREVSGNVPTPMNRSMLFRGSSSPGVPRISSFHGGCSSSSQQGQPAAFHFSCWSLLRLHGRFSSPFLEWVQEQALFVVNRVSFFSILSFRKSPGLYWGYIKDLRRALSPHLPPTTPGAYHLNANQECQPVLDCSDSHISLLFKSHRENSSDRSDRSRAKGSLSPVRARGLISASTRDRALELFVLPKLSQRSLGLATQTNHSLLAAFLSCHKRKCCSSHLRGCLVDTDLTTTTR